MKEYKTRMLWLSLGLLGSLLIAKVIDGFEVTLEKNIVLASFIPLIVYMSDAVGTQMESIIIRALSEEKHFNIRTFLSKQFTLTLFVGITLSIIAGIGIYLFFDGLDLACTVGIGLLGGIMSSLFSGIIVPYYFWKFHQDPAEASGPVATVIQDFVSVFIFFLVARALM